MLKTVFATAAAAGIAIVALSGGVANAERAVPIPAALQDVPKASGLQTAVFAGGCFWAWKLCSNM